VDQFWLVSEGRVSEYEGDLEDYERWLADRRKEAETTKPGSSGAAARADSAAGDNAEDRKARKRVEAELRQRLSPYRKQQKKLETEMDLLQQKLLTLEEQLADPALYGEGHGARLKELLAEQGQAQRRLDDVEADWLAVSETVESLEAELG
jgi:ATP-binding cassette subfamily F protein 3